MTRLLTVALLLLAVTPTFAQQKPRVRAVAFSPDGSRVAGCLGDAVPGRLAVWDAKSGAVQLDLSFPAAVSGLTFSADGATIAVGVGDEARILDAKSGAAVAVLKHPKPVRAVAAGPLDRLATSAGDGVVRVWDTKTKAEVAKTAAGREPVVRLALSPDGKRVAGADGRQCFQWDAATGQPERTFEDGFRYTAGVAFSADGAWLLRCIGNDGTVQVVAATTGAVRTTVKLPGGVNAFAYSPASGVFAASYSFSGSDPKVFVGRVRLDPPTDAERRAVEALLTKLDADALDEREAAGRELLRLGPVTEPFLARALKDSPSAEVRLRARKLRAALTERGHQELVPPPGGEASLAVSPDGQRLAIGGSDGVVRVVALPNGKDVLELRFSASQPGSRGPRLPF